MDELAVKKKYDPDLIEKVKKQLIAKANSIFLWVALARKELVEASRRDILSTFKQLTSGLKVDHGVRSKECKACMAQGRTVQLSRKRMVLHELSENSVRINQDGEKIKKTSTTAN
jgi:hypothetical protein